MIKAIETIYNNYRFRSRLEARWAVFFDTLGIRYVYEKEGYELEGIWYLPDFWLPAQEMWVEIKGDKPTEKEVEKALLLCMLSKKRVAIAWGSIDTNFIFNEVYVPFHYAEEDIDSCTIEEEQVWAECPICHKVDIVHGGFIRNLGCDCSTHQTPRIVDAFKAARQARFEHR